MHFIKVTNWNQKASTDRQDKQNCRNTKHYVTNVNNCDMCSIQLTVGNVWNRIREQMMHSHTLKYVRGENEETKKQTRLFFYSNDTVNQSLSLSTMFVTLVQWSHL